MNEVFAFVALKPCGCVCMAATSHLLKDTLKDKWFAEQMASGKVLAIPDRNCRGAAMRASLQSGNERQSNDSLLQDVLTLPLVPYADGTHFPECTRQVRRRDPRAGAASQRAGVDALEADDWRNHSEYGWRLSTVGTQRRGG